MRRMWSPSMLILCNRHSISFSISQPRSLFPSFSFSLVDTLPPSISPTRFVSLYSRDSLPLPLFYIYIFPVHRNWITMTNIWCDSRSQNENFTRGLKASGRNCNGGEGDLKEGRILTPKTKHMKFILQ